MNTRRKRLSVICGGLTLLALGLYGAGYSYWMSHTKVKIPGPPEAKVLTTGTILGAAGWEFKLVKLLEFGRREVSHLVLARKTWTFTTEEWQWQAMN